ncbi:MAG: aminotransferase class V-fold PLP-dependent enzyme, partial [Bacteroidota bacterium]|nr:aminotransferase class V-fold PLP-dependent enzyme [Bacteroidota bacterium]
MLNLKKIRRQFPSLSRKDNEGNKIIYLDGPAGTQVPDVVIEGISSYYKSSNSNIHGEFITSIETDKIMDSMREKASIFLGAENKNCIS